MTRNLLPVGLSKNTVDRYGRSFLLTTNDRLRVRGSCRGLPPWVGHCFEEEIFMLRNRKATDEQLTEAYNELGSVWRVGKRLGMCGQSVHERLVKMGINKHINVFTPEEDARLLRDYSRYSEEERLAELASELGRAKTTIVKRAQQLGLTNRGRGRRHLKLGKWKYMGEEEARPLFDRFCASGLGPKQFCEDRGLDDLSFYYTMKRLFPDEYAAAIRQCWKRTGERYSGSRNHRWRGGLTRRQSHAGWAKAVKERDGFTCQYCGSQERLCAHHVISWKYHVELRTSVENGITLCRPCHHAIHGYKQFGPRDECRVRIDVLHELLTEDEMEFRS